MIKLSRRNSLKLFASGVASVGALGPLKAMAGMPVAPAAVTAASKSSVLAHESTDVVVSLERSAGNHCLVTVTNQSNAAVTLRHIQPGVVFAQGFSYDLNELVKDGPLTLAASVAMHFSLAPARSAAVSQIKPTTHGDETKVSQVAVKTRFVNLAKSEGATGLDSSLDSVTTVRSLLS